jgi:hypothetical protein
LNGIGELDAVRRLVELTGIEPAAPHFARTAGFGELLRRGARVAPPEPPAEVAGSIQTHFDD